MRSSLVSTAVLLAVGACQRDAPAPAPKPTTTREEKPIAARLADEVARLAPDDVIALPDLGWLQMKRYRAHDGRNPRTGEPVAVPEAWIPFWYPAPGPWDRHLADERHRFLANVHANDPQAFADEDPATHVWRFSWADATCEATAQELATHRRSTLAGVGTFVVENGQVRYTIAPELEQRLALRR